MLPEIGLSYKPIVWKTPEISSRSISKGWNFFKIGISRCLGIPTSYRKVKYATKVEKHSESNNIY